MHGISGSTYFAVICLTGSIRFVIRNPRRHWTETPNLSNVARDLIDQEFSICTSKLISESLSSDQETRKLLIELQDGHRIETVIMKYDTTGRGSENGEEITGGERSTVCVSSQVGCRMGCKFCATGLCGLVLNFEFCIQIPGTMGLQANLTSGEIIEQLLIASQFSEIRNVVFMGMGEPLDNYENVKEAVELIANQLCFGLARHRITISTVGVYHKFRSLAEDLPGVSLAFSLHAPTQELRQQIVPSARPFKLGTVVESLKDYIVKTKQRVFVEYVLLAGINDDSEQAHQVGTLLQGMNVVLNLIPFNPNYAVGINYQAPSKDTVLQFQSIVIKEYQILCTIRQEKGQDISGACGQLAVTYRTNSEQQSLPDVEDLV
eukprot:g1963.t1